MIIDPSPAPTQTILGMSSSPNQRCHVRHSYPASTTEWTEYTSPLRNPQVNFYFDSTGDRSRPMSKSHHEQLGLFSENHTYPLMADASEALITDKINSSNTSSNSVLATKQTTIGTNTPSNDIILSPEQKHVLDLVRSGKK